MKKAIVVGCMDNTKDHTFESANRVYAVGGVLPHDPDLRWWKHTTQNIKEVVS